MDGRHPHDRVVVMDTEIDFNDVRYPSGGDYHEVYNTSMTNEAFDLEPDYDDAQDRVHPLPNVPGPTYPGYLPPGHPPSDYNVVYAPLSQQHSKADSLEEMNFRLRFAYLTPRTDWFQEVRSAVLATEDVDIPVHVLRSVRGYPLTMREKLELSGKIKDLFQNQVPGMTSSGRHHLEKSIEREGKKLKSRRHAVTNTLSSTGFDLVSFWDGSIASIAATFGSNVASYFRFLRFLLILNFVIGLLMFSFVSLPEILDDGLVNNNLTIGFFGELTKTVFFYGAYTNSSITVDKGYYEKPLAYLLTCTSVNVLAILAIVINMYYNYRQSKKTMSDKDDPYSALTLCGWDFSVTTKQGTGMRSTALTTRIREVKREDEDRQNRTFSQKCGIWTIRIICNLTSVAILGACGYLIYYVADRAIDPGDEVPQFIGDFFVKYQLSMVVSFLKLLMPWVLIRLLIFEKWHPRTEIKFQILRTAVFYGANLVVFLISVYTQNVEGSTSTTGNDNSCWENSLAEQIFQIAVLDFVINIGAGLLTLGGPALIIYTCNMSKIRSPEFKVAVNILDLVYSQALVWLGLFVAPFLAWYGVVHLFVTFYINYCLVQKCCVPSKSVFRASRSGSFFRFILLVTLFFCLVPLTYGIANLAPSKTCGPFRDENRIYKVLTNRIGDSPKWLQEVLEYISTPVIALPIFILLVLLAVYYKVKSTTHQMAAKDLQHHLQFERKVEKRRVLANAKMQRAGQVRIVFAPHGHVEGLDAKPSEISEVASSHENGDVESKEVLAPSEGSREDLINTAVKFLQNPKVRTSPLSQKKSFLERKGLTQAEIRIAVERSGVTEDSSQPGINDHPQGVYPPVNYPPPGTALAPAFYPPPTVPIPPQSRWAQVRDLTMTSVIVASVSYAIYQLFQTYLRPLIFGKTAHERRLEKLEYQVEQIHKSVSDSLAEIGQTLQAIQASINTQQTSQNVVNQVDSRGVTDLKSDIASLKGLLLNRNQFPPAPATSPMLPSWQRISSSPHTLNTNLANQSSATGQDVYKLDSDLSGNENPLNQVGTKVDTLDSPTDSRSVDGVDRLNERIEDVTDTNSNLDDQD